MKNIEEIKNYFNKEIDQTKLMSNKHKNVCTALNSIEHYLILASAVTGCISIYAFPSLLGIPIGITSSGIGLNLCAITAGINEYKSIIKKKKHDQIVFFANIKLNSMEVFISKALILSKFAVCDTKKSRFIKEQEASGLLSSLVIKTPLTKIPLVGPLLF